MSATNGTSRATSTDPGTGQERSFEVGGADAPALYRAAIAAVLEALYGSAEPPQGEGGGGVLPLQAAGRDESERLRGLLAELLREAPSSPGRLLPPSGVSFDDKRATATLRLGPAGGTARSLRVGAVRVDSPPGGGLTASITVGPAR